MSAEIKVIDLKYLNVNQAIGVYLVEINQTPVLIESGPHSTYDRVVETIEASGYQIEDIQHVLLTHIHLDHAGAAWEFAKHGATVYVHPSGIRHLEDPSKLMASAKMIYKDDMDRLWGRMEPIPKEQLVAVAHEQIITIAGYEFKSLHTPGHAKHHIAWQFNDVIFGGDVGGVTINNGPIQPPCPPPDINVEEWRESIEVIRAAKPAKIYLTHFGEVTDVPNHLDQLNVMLTDWADFVKGLMAKELSTEEMVPLFVEYSNKQLSDGGQSPEQVKQYQAANPSWMSVHGLVRYWNKKERT